MPTFRYHYAADNPPAPAVLLNLADPDSAARVQDNWGLVDSGADQTVLPVSLVVNLGLAKLDVQLIHGFDGTPQLLETYIVLLQIRDLLPIVVEVIASEHVSHPILGRDVLNRYVMTLDGPKGMLEITGD